MPIAQFGIVMPGVALQCQFFFADVAWAQAPNKPEKLNEQIAMLREIGHNLENFHFWQKDTTIGFNRQKEQNKRNHKNKPAQSQNDNNGKKAGKKRKREEKE